MCGIGGYKGKLFSQRKELVLDALAQGLKSRGEHAVGIGFYNKEKGKVFKAPMKPSQVDWKTLFSFSPCLSDTVIFHNRFATHGKPEINKNNHPFMGEGFLLAHNGVLSNHMELLKEYDLVVSEKEPETDSYALVKVLNKLTKEKDIVESLKELCPKVNGSMVLTILCEDGRLILVRGSKYSYKLYRINGENYIYASAANAKGQKEHIDIALEPLLLELYKETEGNFTIEKIDVPEWSICIIDSDGSLKWESFEKPKVVSTASYNIPGKNKNNNPTNYTNYYSGCHNRQTSLFDDDLDFYNYNSPYGLTSYSKNSTYINDVMDVLQDEWPNISAKKFDYNLVRDVVEMEVSGCEDIFPPSIMAEELICNGSLDELI